MKTRSLVPWLLAPIALGMPCVTLASSTHVNGPRIQIVSPHSGVVVDARHVVIHTSVSNIRLTSQQHVNYVLDGLSNFVASRDATVALVHGWSYVAPGPHTVTVYLANSTNQQLPNTQRVSTRIMVVSKPGAGGAGITSMPKTGGATDLGTPARLPGSAIGILALLLGLALLWPAVARNGKRI